MNHTVWQVAVRRFPELSVATPRLYVRRLVDDDAKGVTEIFADRYVRRWLPFSAEYGPIEGLTWCTELAEERRSSGEGDHYGIFRREDEALVGVCWTRRTDWGAMVTEVSGAIAPAARGEGYAAEAVDAVAMSLFGQHGFRRVELRLAPGNASGRRVAEKAGFRYEGLLRDAGYVHSGRVDVEIWSLVVGDLS